VKSERFCSHSQTLEVSVIKFSLAALLVMGAAPMAVSAQAAADPDKNVTGGRMGGSDRSGDPANHERQVL
jgi:hypothetical protein